MHTFTTRKRLAVVLLALLVALSAGAAALQRPGVTTAPGEVADCTARTCVGFAIIHMGPGSPVSEVQHRGASTIVGAVKVDSRRLSRIGDEYTTEQVQAPDVHQAAAGVYELALGSAGWSIDSAAVEVAGASEVVEIGAAKGTVDLQGGMRAELSVSGTALRIRYVDGTGTPTEPAGASLQVQLASA